MVKSPIITTSLAVLCLGLGWTVYADYHRPVPLKPVVGQAASGPILKGQDRVGSKRTAIALPPIEAFGEIVARPLFNVSRRPIVVEEPIVPEKTSELKVMLSGIVIGHSQQIAHLRSETDKRTRALSVGDKIDNWRIESILPDRVVLRSGGRVETLLMQKPGAQNAGRSQRNAAGRERSPRRAVKRPKRRTGRNYRRNRRERNQ